jgi:hypothetical protein
MSAFSKLVAKMCDRPEGHPVLGVGFSERLDDLAKAHPDSPEWRRSISDLLKILDLDPSYGARKKLALELGYGQDLIDTKGSAEMNLWLLAEVMKRLADEGAKVPQEALD